jgi:N6-adenosine-specific RNA methylase IME4
VGGLASPGHYRIVSVHVNRAEAAAAAARVPRRAAAVPTRPDAHPQPPVVLDLVHRARAKVCLPLPDELTFDEWKAQGADLARVEKGVQWWVGDWWAFGQHHYGDRAKACAEGLFGRSFGALRNAGSVARQFETSRRRDVLSYQHHAEVASLPPGEADAVLDEAEANGWSTREVRAAVSRLKTAATLPAPSEADTCTVADLGALVASCERFGCIYADPPWRYENQATRASTGDHYAAGEKNDHTGMSVDQICELPVRELAAADAHLHLWTTNAFLFECPKIFKAWGFEFRSSFVWVKPQIGIGNYWRNSHEILLTAIRGDAKRFNDHSLQSWIECSRGKHSDKPEQIRGLIEGASTGPFLELFGRRVAPGWAVWGNQIERTMFDAGVRALAKENPQ